MLQRNEFCQVERSLWWYNQFQGDKLLLLLKTIRVSTITPSTPSNPPLTPLLSTLSFSPSFYLKCRHIFQLHEIFLFSDIMSKRTFTPKTLSTESFIRRKFAHTHTHKKKKRKGRIRNRWRPPSCCIIRLGQGYFNNRNGSCAGLI